MVESITHLEQRIDRLRAEVRRAVIAGDRVRARALRGELRKAEDAWEEALADIEDRAPTPTVSRGDAPLLPLREQVHQALTLLRGPAAPRLVVAVHEAFFGGEMLGTRLTSLRRDEERSFAAAPYSRAYYICSALTADLLSAARGLLAVSSWPLADRMIGPLSPRVDFLTAAVEVARHIERLDAPGPRPMRLLWRFAANIPGAGDEFDAMRPSVVARAAEAELDVHREADQEHRARAADRARRRLTDVEQLFGSRLGVVRAGSGA